MSAPLPSAVLLVTGSRALWDTQEAAGWAWGTIHAAVKSLPRDGLVVAGDARGPDTWAMECARLTGRAERWYALDGRVRGFGVPRGREWAQRSKQTMAPRAWPLYRNECMVAEVAQSARDGVPVYVLALVAPWSTTAGTLHTARLAQRERLWTDVRTAPAALGPQGARS